MIGYGYGYNGWSMMGGAIGINGVLISIAILIDLVLVGIWLWQHIAKK